MKRGIFIGFFLLWCLLAGARPAYANNPPQPDGMLSLILIFPVVVLGVRLAAARLSNQSRAWRITKGIGLAVAFVLTMGGTEIALIPLLILLCYGLVRGVQVMRRGQGKKRFAIGAAVMLFTLFAISNYAASPSNTPTVPRTEAMAVAMVSRINTGETEFQSKGLLDVNKNGVGEYGSLEQLRPAGLLDDSFPVFSPRFGYGYIVVLSGDPARDEKGYFVYATPIHYGEESTAWFFLPGASLVKAFHPPPPFGRRTFASDETGVMRAADLGGSRAVTREEAQKWKPPD